LLEHFEDKKFGLLRKTIAASKEFKKKVFVTGATGFIGLHCIH